MHHNGMDPVLGLGLICERILKAVPRACRDVNSVARLEIADLALRPSSPSVHLRPGRLGPPEINSRRGPPLIVSCVIHGHARGGQERALATAASIPSG